ncbi:MAG: hypothetical protein N2254_07490 [bacterium]|nr:hypothetical protein [bacterium]
MILRIIISAALVALCYIIYEANLFIKIPGMEKIQSLYTSHQDLCGQDLQKQLIKSKETLQTSFEFQNSFLLEQIKSTINTIKIVNQKVDINIGKISMIPQDSFPQKFFVSLGQKDGIEKYSFVLKDGFVIGRVVDVGLDTSEVITVFSQMFYVDVIFLGLGFRAILQGDPSGKMKIFATYGGIDFEKVPPNTLLVTAGSKNNSPFGIPVAYVSKDKKIIALSDFSGAVYVTNIKEIEAENQN